MTPNPFLTIWLSPRETIRRIVEWNPNYWVIALACLAGIGQAFDQASMKNIGDETPTALIFAIALVAGPLVGLLQLWIGYQLIRWTGRWLGGMASREHLRTALAWGYVPAVFALTLLIPEWLIAGPELFTKQTPHLNAHPGLLMFLKALGAVGGMLGIWSIVTTCHTVAEVQGYRSAWRGLANLLLPFTLVIGLILVAILIPLIIIKGGAALFH
ncbi:MAG: YIP1 family protein [Verrucomicrobia bacterium]|nr:YIP1 family protein [Verrucomicrobiota bacterium]